MQASKQASKQASRQAGWQASRKTSKQAGKQAGWQASKLQVYKRSSRQASSRKAGKHAAGTQASNQALRGHSVGAMPWRGLFTLKLFPGLMTGPCWTREDLTTLVSKFVHVELLLMLCLAFYCLSLSLITWRQGLELMSNFEP